MYISQRYVGCLVVYIFMERKWDFFKIKYDSVPLSGTRQVKTQHFLIVFVPVFAGEEEHDSDAFSQSMGKDTLMASDKTKDMASVLQSLENGSGALISDLLVEGGEESAAAASA